MSIPPVNMLYFYTRLAYSYHLWENSNWWSFSGKEIVAVDSPVGRLGLTVCYDLRFPEIHQQLRFHHEAQVQNLWINGGQLFYAAILIIFSLYRWCWYLQHLQKLRGRPTGRFFSVPVQLKPSAMYEIILTCYALNPWILSTCLLKLKVRTLIINLTAWPNILIIL